MRTITILTVLGLLCGTVPALAQDHDSSGGRGNQEFIGVDLDNGGVYYNGRNSGRYCVYQTVEVFNRLTGYVEPRRVRRCGRGLYLR
ncbi:hypothetical protein ABZT49_00495 [Methylobacterium sp. EM32]|uniref:hypothetical protein n=1 Tax=Methylobacterium sp. EM32 TaxID=3163481 RepID=UPI0033AF9DB2